MSIIISGLALMVLDFALAGVNATLAIQHHGGVRLLGWCGAVFCASLGIYVAQDIARKWRTYRRYG